ncbi:MAG: hypothetical protein IJ309_04940 [Clostridia bacterium]|nr:hypothetical protein [Clostridia bacterium]
MEQIYTIPVNEAFEECRDSQKCDCPLCKIYDKLERKEVELTLGPAMMEPSTRIQTNEKGFCKHHFDLLLLQNNRLSLALILESHIDEIKNKMKGNFFSNILGTTAKRAVKTAGGVSSSCFICERIEFNFERMLETAVLLYSLDPDFRGKLRAQKYFCLPHYQRLMEMAQAKLNKKKFQELSKDVSDIENAYLEKLKGDITWFTKKFDYRYDSEPWYDSKDAIERAIALLSSGITPEKK